MTARWAIITGEYPPQPGGVADYTRQVAVGLAATGDRVTVIAPAHAGGTAADPGVDVVRLADHFGPRGLLALDRALSQQRVDRLLVQYVPHAYGWKAMNLPFAAWLAARAGRLAPLWVMFHEVAFPFHWRPPTYAVLCAVTRAMARLVAGAADRVFVSTTSWGPLLRRLCPRLKPVEWLPVPSNILSVPAAAPLRTGPEKVIGHFGTYGASREALLEPALLELLRGEDRRAALLGRGSIDFRAQMIGRHPALAERVLATGELTSSDLAARLRDCDVLLQPFEDGISSRRTSAMAGLASGVPIVSNLGPLSEPLWDTLGCLGLARSPNSSELAASTEGVLALSLADRAAMGERAAQAYRELFGLENTIARLRVPVRGAA